MPNSKAASIVGRTYSWSNTFQYHLLRSVWPEVELNSTFFQDGRNDGKKQNFVSPGLVPILNGSCHFVL
jgi:hypothetical protein